MLGKPRQNQDILEQKYLTLVGGLDSQKKIFKKEKKFSYTSHFL